MIPIAALLLPKSIKGWVTLVAIGSILVLAGLAYWHYNSLVNELIIVKADKIILEQAVQTQQQTVDRALSTIDEWKNAQERFSKTVEKLTEVNQEANEKLEKLNEKFGSHNLSDLSKKKPGLIEGIINRGTADSLRLLQCSSGAKGINCSRRPKEAGQDSGSPKPATD